MQCAMKINDFIFQTSNFNSKSHKCSVAYLSFHFPSPSLKFLLFMRARERSCKFYFWSTRAQHTWRKLERFPFWETDTGKGLSPKRLTVLTAFTAFKHSNILLTIYLTIFHHFIHFSLLRVDWFANVSCACATSVPPRAWRLHFHPLLRGATRQAVFHGNRDNKKRTKENWKENRDVNKTWTRIQ